MSEIALSELTSRYFLLDLIFGLLALFAWIAATRLVRRWFDPPLPVTQTPPWLALLQGLAWGIGALALTVLPGVMLGVYDPAHPDFAEYLHQIPQLSERTPKLIFGMFLVQSLYEELLFRGVIMALLGSLLFWAARLAFFPKGDFDPATGRAQLWLAHCWFWCGILAGLATSLAFGIQHAGNPDSSPFALINIALAGMALGQLYWMHGSVLGAWTMHFAWNAGLATLGLPISGWALSEPLFGLGVIGAVPGILSGGTFGPEASVFASAALLLVYLAMLRIAWQSVRFIQTHSAAEAIAEAAQAAQ